MQRDELYCFWRLLLVWLALVTPASGFGAPVISEFLAANDSVLTDEDGAFSDWIEIHNPEVVSISLAGYHLTDDPEDLGKWTFPAVTLDPGAYLVVFASGKNRTDPAGELHTDFRLSAEGEYLALVAPDGATAVSAFAPAYPPQFENESFGLGAGASPPGWSFFSTPTPGTTNGSGTRAGPVVYTLVTNPPPPVSGPLIITARVLPANSPVSTVSLYYRWMFAAEAMVPMRDDGSEGDAHPGDGIWTAAIPAAMFTPGRMTRWRVVAIDSLGTATREPAFRAPLDSQQYFGTVTEDPGIGSALPVFHWFTANPAGA